VPVDVAPALASGIGRPAPSRGTGLQTEQAGVLRARARIDDALVAHDFRAAIASCRALLAERPRDLGALLALSDAHLELGELDEAEAALQHVLDLKPAAPAYLRAGYLLHLRGKGDEAVAAFDLALDAIEPRQRRVRAWALAEQGHLLRQQGELEQADRRFAAALALDDRCAEAWRGRALVAWAHGALSDAERCWRLAAPSPAGLGALARLLAERGDTAGARRALRRALDLGASDPHWNRSLALCLADAGLEVERAVALAEAELEIRPGVHTWDAYAWALHAAGRHTEALAAIERALAPGVREPLLLHHAGQIALAAGDPRGQAWLDAARHLDPTLTRG
jgi:tetratricopeptide (TPR) repeat protein